MILLGGQNGGGSARGTFSDLCILSNVMALAGLQTGPVSSVRRNGVGVDTANNRMIMFGSSFPEGGLWNTWVLTHPNGM
jgi:hypothetical protein